MGKRSDTSLAQHIGNGISSTQVQNQNLAQDQASAQAQGNFQGQGQPQCNTANATPPSALSTIPSTVNNSLLTPMSSVGTFIPPGSPPHSMIQFNSLSSPPIISDKGIETKNSMSSSSKSSSPGNHNIITKPSFSSNQSSEHNNDLVFGKGGNLNQVSYQGDFVPYYSNNQSTGEKKNQGKNVEQQQRLKTTENINSPFAPQPQMNVQFHHSSNITCPTNASANLIPLQQNVHRNNTAETNDPTGNKRQKLPLETIINPNTPDGNNNLLPTNNYNNHYPTTNIIHNGSSCFVPMFSPFSMQGQTMKQEVQQWPSNGINNENIKPGSKRQHSAIESNQPEC